MNARCSPAPSFSGPPANLLSATDLMMIFLFLHSLNYLHAPNILIGILFLKASAADFHKEMKMIGGVVCLSSQVGKFSVTCSLPTASDEN